MEARKSVVRHDNRSVASETIVMLEERLLHFMKWIEQKNEIELLSRKTAKFLNHNEIEKLIIDYVEG